MPIAVAEMTSDDLRTLILLLAHQHHLASLYAEFADDDLILAKAGMSEYADLLAREDSARYETARTNVG